MSRCQMPANGPISRIRRHSAGSTSTFSRKVIEPETEAIIVGAGSCGITIANLLGAPLRLSTSRASLPPGWRVTSRNRVRARLLRIT